jgi:hypothetical protein
MWWQAKSPGQGPIRTHLAHRHGCTGSGCF